MARLRKSARFDITKVDVEHFLEVVEVENLTKATEDEWNFSCPFPGHQHGDSKPSAYMNEHTTAWKCHGCKRGGNAITFAAEWANVSNQQATKFLRDRYGNSIPDPDSYSVLDELDRFYAKRERQEPEFDVLMEEDVIDGFLIDWERVYASKDRPEPLDYMLTERGFSPETLDEWQIGFDPDWDRIMIPVRNHEGWPVGFKGRAYREEHQPKYLVMGGDEFDYPRYKKSRYVFGLNKALSFGAEEGEMHDSLPELIICEGELDVMAMWEKGFENVAGVAGSEFSTTQARLIRNYADSVTLFFDTDSGGAMGTLKVIEMLAPYMRVKVVPDHEGDPASMTHEEIVETLQESESALKVALMG